MSNQLSSGSLKRLIGAIYSGHPAAFVGIIVKAISLITHRIDPPFRRRSSAYSGQPPLPIRCAFIVCPPRSGGTVIYQALTCALPSVYLSNVHALFPSLGTRLLRAGHKRLETRQTFNNYCGYTSHLLDVYEGNEFFEWIHRIPPGISNEEQNQYLRTEFGKVIKLLSPLPSESIILKNVRAYSAVAKLHHAIPEIVFIRVRRDRQQVIESVVHAFHELGHFHPVPDSLRKMVIKDPIEFAFAQINTIEANLDEQFSLLPKSSQFEIPYEAFCERPHEFVEKLAYDFLKFPYGSVQRCPALTRLRPSTRCKVSGDERLKIQELIQLNNSRVKNVYPE